MSYCVHCGVELDATAERCALCQTVVMDPTQAVDAVGPKPFPRDPGVVAPVSRMELALLISAMLVSVALCCGLLNLFIYAHRWWSLYGMGLAMLLWLFFVPPLVHRRMPLFLRLGLDALGLGVYVALVAWELNGMDWYMGMALPIILLGGAMVIALGFSLGDQGRSLLSGVTLIIGAIGLFLVGVESFADRYFYGQLALGWSLVVLAICVALVIPLIIVRRIPSLREEARKRFHL